MTAKTTADVFWNKFSVYLFDADGVLWRGKKILPHAAEVVNELISRGRRVFILTNNSTRTPVQVLKHMEDLGYRGLKTESIITSGVVTAEYVKQHVALDLPVYVIGSQALGDVLQDVGATVLGVGEDPITNYTNDPIIRDLELVPPKVSSVVCSFDTHLSYVKIMKAVNYLQDPTVPFLATNTEPAFPAEDPNLVIPGPGVSTAAVEFVSGRKATLMGKPGNGLLEYLQRRVPLDAAQCLMIGDRLDTDILFGNRNHLATLMTLTGVHSRTDIARASAEGWGVPDLVVESLSELFDNRPIA